MRQLSLSQNAEGADRVDLVSTNRVEAPQFAPDRTGYQGIRLRCTRCNANLNGFDCPFCGFEMRISRGIVHALPPDRAAHYAQFIKDYERIRHAEGRGSKADDFYLSLPFSDATGTNSKHWKIRARSFSYLMRHILNQALSADCRRVLDLGAGNCWMSYRLSQADFRPVAVDLLTNDEDGLGAAVHFQNRLPALFPRFQAELGRLPFQDGQFDMALFNASLHYSEDYACTLREALRCIKKTGLVVVIDTPWYSSDESGRAMLAERRAGFLRCYGTPSDSIRSLEYLTDERLHMLEDQLSIRWTTHCPRYGLMWAMRPAFARLQNRREPSRFRIYVARKP